MGNVVPLKVKDMKLLKKRKWVVGWDWFLPLFLSSRLAVTFSGIRNGRPGTLLSMGRTIGDGLAAVDSAILKVVPLIMVHGTHLTMIRNLLVSSRRIPPAIPLILKMLTP